MFSDTITLTAPSDVISFARDIAERGKTTVSALFVDFIRSKALHEDRFAISPAVQALSGVVKLPHDFDDRIETEKAVFEALAGRS